MTVALTVAIAATQATSPTVGGAAGGAAAVGGWLVAGPAGSAGPASRAGSLRSSARAVTPAMVPYPPRPGRLVDTRAMTAPSHRRPCAARASRHDLPGTWPLPPQCEAPP